MTGALTATTPGEEEETRSGAASSSGITALRAYQGRWADGGRDGGVIVPASVEPHGNQCGGERRAEWSEVPWRRIVYNMFTAKLLLHPFIRLIFLFFVQFFKYNKDKLDVASAAHLIH